MPNKENKNQYSLVAKLAYKFVTEERLSFSKAYEKAAYSIIKSDESAVKPCPRSTFIGLCEYGNLKNITSLKSSNKINTYSYSFLNQKGCAKYKFCVILPLGFSIISQYVRI